MKKTAKTVFFSLIPTLGIHLRYEVIECSKHSRILSIVDAYDAMTSDRIYRKGLSHQVAIEELKRHAQSQFDAQLVDIFIEIIDDYIQNNPEN